MVDPLKLSGASVLVVGDLMVDEYVYGKSERISPEAPIPVLETAHTEYRLGGAANVACNVKALQGKVALVGALGFDPAANEVVSLCRQTDIQLYAVQTHDMVQTTRRVRLVGQGNHQLVRVDYGTVRRVSPANMIELIDHALDELPSVRCIVLSDYAKGVVSAEVCHYLRQLSRHRGIPWLVDPKPSSEAVDKYHGCTLIKPNRKEAEGLLGRPLSQTADVEHAGQELVGKFGAAVLITLASEGMRLFTPHGSRKFTATLGKVVDVVGAGDTVSATLGMALSAGVSLEGACELASVAAGLSVSKPGTATVSLEELSPTWRRAETKVTTVPELLARWSRSARPRVVAANGCFDIFHAGHVDLLHHARQLGEFLVVALNTDDSVRRLKGPSRPVHNWHHRAQVLASMAAVDAVVPFDSSELYQTLRPDVVVHGAETSSSGRTAQTVTTYGGKFVEVSKSALSTSGALRELEASPTAG